MKLLILILFLFPTAEPTTIAWSEEQHLTWNDFQGIHDAKSPFAASTHTSIVFSYNIKIEDEKRTLSTQVNAYFYPEMSWYNPKEVNDHILKHEQAHFNITEIHARKLRKAFSKYRVTKNYKKEVIAIFTKISDERQQMQTRFDKETNHSIHKEHEKSWQNYIQEELKKLERWKLKN